MAVVSIATFAQAEVKGFLVDSLTNVGEPYATVWIARPDAQEKVVSSSVTDLDGRFSLNVSDSGVYILRVSSVGKTPVVRSFYYQGKVLDLGTIYIVDDTKKIEGVDVVASKPLIKMDIDKIEFSVKDDPDSKTYTVLEMLRKVPMVTVDGQDNISVNGSSSFQVYMNGKPNAMLSANPKETLRAMPATGIKSISVITNPGAKYDAEGVGGILNIITEQNTGMSGYTASMYAMGGNMVNGGGIYSMLQKDKLTVGVNVTDMAINTPDVITTGHRNESDGSLMLFENKSGNFQNTLRSSVDINYDVNSLNSVALNIGFSRGTQDIEYDALTTVKNNGGEYSYGTTTDNDVKSTSIDASLDYRHIFAGNNNHNITLAYRVSAQPRTTDARSSYTLAGMEDYNQTDDNNMVEQTAQVDYSLPLGEMNTVELGAKYISRDNSSTTDMLDYNHNSNILGTYLSYTLRYKSFGLKTGLRYEHTYQDVTYKKGLGEDFDTRYDNVVPSATLSYSLGYTQTLSLGYNMRLSRPGITYLNPYRNTQSLTSVSYGNPDLDVEKANNIQATYSLFGQKVMLNTSLQYSFVNNSIEEYTFNEDGVLYSTYDNIGKRKSTSLNVFLNLTLGKGTRLMLNATGSYVDLRSPSLGYSNSGWQGSLMASLQQDLPLELKLSATYFGNSDNVTLQGKSAGMNFHTVGLSRSFLNNRMSVSINGISPFVSNLKMKTETSGHDFGMVANTDVPIRSVLATVSIQLGSLKSKAKQKKKNDTDLINREDENAGITKLLVQ